MNPDVDQQQSSHETLAEHVLSGLIDKNEKKGVKTVLSTNPRMLENEYGLAEAIGAGHINLDDTDMVVVLSGRSGFDGSYAEEQANRYVLYSEFDSTDTTRRLSYGISIAKACAEKNALNGIEKPVYVYFNGLPKQNDQLRAILEAQGSIEGYPADLFIIDGIQLKNTLGQVIGLSYFLDKKGAELGFSRTPNIVFCTSSYHVPRVVLGVGSNSPILTPDFWVKRPDLLEQLTPDMQDYVLNPGDTLKHASIMVLGCDRKICAVECGYRDLVGDMEARVNYSSPHLVSSGALQPPPSLASNVADNIVTLYRAYSKAGLSRRSRMFDRVTEVPHSDDSRQDHKTPAITLTTYDQSAQFF